MLALNITLLALENLLTLYCIYLNRKSETPLPTSIMILVYVNLIAILRRIYILIFLANFKRTMDLLMPLIAIGYLASSTILMLKSDNLKDLLKGSLVGVCGCIWLILESFFLF